MKPNFKLSDETRQELRDLVAALTHQYPDLAYAAADDWIVASRCDCGGGCRGSCTGQCGGCGGNCKGSLEICSLLL